MASTGIITKMGCFGAVCNLSGLPIHDGDPVKLIINLPGTGRDTGLTNISDLRIPCCLPISGTYDDYGCIENVQEDENTLAVTSIFETALQYKWMQRTNRYSNRYDSEPGIMPWLNQIGIEGYRLGQYPGDLQQDEEGSPMSYSLILQEVWDSYLLVYDRDRKARDWIARTCDDWFQWYKRIAVIVRANPDDVSASCNASRWGINAEYSATFIDIAMPRSVRRLPFMSGNSYCVAETWFTAIYFDGYLHPRFLIDAFQGSHRSWTWFRDQYAEFLAISRLMTKLPVFWLPVMATGQDKQYELHTKLSHVRHKLSKRRQVTWEQDL